VTSVKKDAVAHPLRAFSAIFHRTVWRIRPQRLPPSPPRSLARAAPPIARRIASSKGLFASASRCEKPCLFRFYPVDGIGKKPPKPPSGLERRPSFASKLYQSKR
jgi:hypothetical protein